MIENDIRDLKAKCAAINRRLDKEWPTMKKLHHQLFSARAEHNSLSVRVANLEKKDRPVKVNQEAMQRLHDNVPEQDGFGRLFYVGQMPGQVGVYASHNPVSGRKWECRTIELRDDEPNDIIEKLKAKIQWLEERLEWKSSDVGSNPVAELKERLQNDDDWAWSWHCNVAIHAQDMGVSHEIANKSAARFMSSVFNVDVTKFSQWVDFMDKWRTQNEKAV